MKKITLSERRALEAVARGDVLRIYRNDGAFFKAPPGLAATLGWLAARSMIIDGATLIHGGVETQMRVALTERGKAALATGITTSRDK